MTGSYEIKIEKVRCKRCSREKMDDRVERNTLKKSVSCVEKERRASNYEGL